MQILRSPCVALFIEIFIARKMIINGAIVDIRETAKSACCIPSSPSLLYVRASGSLRVWNFVEWRRTGTRRRKKKNEREEGAAQKRSERIKHSGAARYR